MSIDMKASVKVHKIGDMTILGTDQDFRESPLEAVSGGFEGIMDRRRRRDRKYAARKVVDPMKNRIDRMKSYYFKRGMDWNLDYDDFLRLWETAPSIYDPEKGEVVPAIEYSNRKSRLRLARKRQLDRYINYENACLKLKNRVYHTLT